MYITRYRSMLFYIGIFLCVSSIHTIIFHDEDQKPRKIEHFLLQSPKKITLDEVDQLPRFWSANFSMKDAVYHFLYVNGHAAIKLTGDNISPYITSLWQDLADSKEIKQLTSDEQNGYYIDEVRTVQRLNEHDAPQIISVDDAATFIKNNTVLFYTGAGISVAAGIADMSRLMKLLSINPRESAQDYAVYVKEHDQEICKNFVEFCNQAFTNQPTKAHYALTDITLFKGTQIMTENFDFLHQRSGVLPYCINAESLRKNVSPQELQKISAVVCIGLSHDDRGFLGWYKRHNPQGTIIAFDIGTPDYLDAHDFIVKGDAQETVCAVRDMILRKS